MPYRTILFTKAASLALVTLNRPEVLNAINFQMSCELDDALGRCETDDEVRAIIITGAGIKAFSSGADIHEMRQLSKEESERQNEERYKHWWHVATCPKPTIGALNGLCYGGGAVLASALDLRMGCTRTSFKFLGASYGRVNSTWTLPYIVGWAVARDLLLTARDVSAEEALKLNLLNRLVPENKLVDEALDLGKTIACNNPKAVQGVKGLLLEHVGSTFREMWLREKEARGTTLAPPPTEESFKQFLERKGREEG